ncbi:MAG: threonylcarbamoyl-AMP synthase [Christensenellaceae bacterium]|nr:threonylcarbamoyl-AMP synthase [Christensenellaceae bacterium]MDD6926494.1 L-threonylcarbamoyladenylate synthase [bacterium]
MKTLVLKPDKESLAIAADIIKSDGLVAFPTETVYGLGALATSGKAVKSVYEAKGRPSDNPLIVHVHKDYDISELVYDDFPYVEKLRKAFLPGPLTLVYRSKGMVASEVSCGLDSLAIRIPSDENAQAFLRACDVPVAAPSANVSKHISPVTAEHVYEDLNGKIPLILDGGRCSGGIESTVLDVTTETPLILRSGLVTSEMIKKVVGKCEYAQHKEGDKIKSPGVKYKHYSPKCKTKFFERKDLDKAVEEYKSALNRGLTPIILCDDEIKSQLMNVNAIDIGKTSKELAENVYEALHEAEKISDFIIGIELVGDSEIDVGVMNRFFKATRDD